MARNTSVGAQRGGLTRGAASGVNYFSDPNLTPAPETIQDETATSGSGLQIIPPESFNTGGPGTGSTSGGRDLAVNPLSPTEISALGLIAGAMPTPIGAAIGFNYGQQTGSVLGTPGSLSPVSLASTTGANTVAGMSTPQALSSALFHATNGILGSTVTAPAANPMQSDPATRGGQTAENAGSGNALGGGVGGYGVGPGTGIGIGGTPGMSMGGPNGAGTGPTSGNGPVGGSGPVGGGFGMGVGGFGHGPGTGIGGGGSPGASMGGPNGGGSGPTGGNGYADGGMVTERYAGLLPQRLAEGGEVQGPLLAMGFADGGMMPPPGGAGMSMPSSDMSPQMIDMRVSQLLSNPQVKQKLIQGVQQYMQSGQLTPQEVQTMGQVAEACLQNPDLYPRLRQFVAQQGMTPLPPAYDPMIIMKILAISRAVGGMAPGGTPAQGVAQEQQDTPAGQIPPTSTAQMQNPTGMATGGFLQGPGTGTSDSIGTVNTSSGQPVKVSSGEYVIPAHVVAAKGKDFFDSLLRKYAQV